MVAPALEAADSLLKEGTGCRVLNMSTLVPLDEEAIVKAAADTGAIVTAEEHLEHGGLGSAVATVTGKRYPVPVEIIALHGYAQSGKPADLLPSLRSNGGEHYPGSENSPQAEIISI